MPRISARLLPAETATRAENCELRSGDIVPTQVGAVVQAPLISQPVNTIYHFDGQWLSWASDVDVVRGFVATGTTARLYYTGDGAPKKTTIAAASSGAFFPLGVEPANGTLTPTLSGTGTGPNELRCYVYTYVTSFGEEGVPSLPGAEVIAQDGQIATLVGFVPSTDATVTAYRIYRKAQTTGGSRFLFVAEIPSTSTSYADSRLNRQLGEPLVSQQWYPPPSNMIGLVAHPAGFMAGYADNTLYLSQPYQPHAYPPSFARYFDYPIVALGVFGSTIVVTTTGYTYLVAGNNPATVSVERLPDPYPCVSKKSLVSSDRAVIYATDVGLVSVGYNGVNVITRDVMTDFEWAKYNPPTIIGAVYDGRYYGWYLTGPQVDYDLADPVGRGFVYDINDRATGVSQRDKLTELSFYAVAAHASPGVKLHYVTRVGRKNVLTRWGSGGYATATWRSKDFVEAGLSQWGTVKVVYDGPGVVTFSLLVDGQERFARQVASSRRFRLPILNKTEERWSFEITSNAPRVREVHLSTSMSELVEQQ
jgi:hypothetical protein